MDTTYVETLCSSCLLRVTADPNVAGADGNGNWRHPYVEIQLFSAHREVETNAARGRLIRAVAALRSQPLPWLEFSSREELDVFIGHLVRARDIAFDVT